jgi:multisubunit Na+/H+ antiporter MnhE subunit
VQIVSDTGVVFGALARQLFGRGRPRSEFVNVPIRVDRDRATRNARDLLTTVRVSMTPNTYVVGIDEEENQMLVHQIVRTHPQSVDDLLSPTE